MTRTAPLAFRPLAEADYAPVLETTATWWDHASDAAARERRGLLPRLFFQHFSTSSFIAIADGKMIGFLIGFLSQSDPTVAYVHFVGVDPAQRGAGTGRALYEHFFAIARGAGRHSVHAITSSTNTGSQEFHRAMGFSVSDPVAEYDGPGTSRVLFRRDL